MTLVTRSNTDYVPTIFDDFFKTDWFGGTLNRGTLSTPAVNIMETEDAFKVAVAAPGMKKDDFNIELDNELLTISAEQKSEEENTENGRFTRREFAYSTFKRTFTLPDSINSASIEANYTDGVLNIMLPKREEAKTQPKRLIEIS